MSTAAPRYTVVMPAHNTEAFIGEAIDSVLAQTVAEWELIVVDDGSTDSTVAIVADYQDQRVILIRQENGGVSAARNTGVAAARASLILFLDSDDRLRPDALERLGAALDRNPRACCAYGDWVFISEQGIPIGSESKPRFTPRPSGDVLEQMLANSFLVAVGSICARSQYVRQLGGWREYTIGEDWEYWCRLAALGEFVYIGEGPVLEYRRRNQSAVNRLGQDAGEIFKVIGSVYANPDIRRNVPKRTLLRLWRKRMSIACAFSAKHNLAAGHWARAVGLIVRSIWFDALNPAALVLPRIVLQTYERRSRK